MGVMPMPIELGSNCQGIVGGGGEGRAEGDSCANRRTAAKTKRGGGLRIARRQCRRFNGLARWTADIRVCTRTQLVLVCSRAFFCYPVKRSPDEGGAHSHHPAHAHVELRRAARRRGGAQPGSAGGRPAASSSPSPSGACIRRGRQRRGLGGNGHQRDLRHASWRHAGWRHASWRHASSGAWRQTSQRSRGTCVR